MAVTDIRLDVEFFHHPKTVKLRHKLGLEGIMSLLKLWMWAAKNRPNGTLSNLDIEDIEIAANWEGKPGTFHAALVALRWLDVINIEGSEVYQLHDWLDHNTWVADAVNRGDRARLVRMASTHPSIYNRLIEEGRDSITRDEYLSLTNGQRDVNSASTDVTTHVNSALTPPPSPSPSPSPEPDIKEDRDNNSPKRRQEDRPTLTQAQQETIEHRARQCSSILAKFSGYHPRDDDNAWFESLYKDPKYKGVDIYREIVDALKWTNRKDFAVKNARSYFQSWLENLHKTRKA